MPQYDLPGTGSDVVRVITAVTGPETYRLAPNLAPGRKITIRRIDDGSSGNALTITLLAGQSLDGVVDGTATISGNQEATFVPVQTGQWESFGLSSGGGGGGVGTGEVTTPKLADGAVTTAKLDTAAVTPAKLSFTPATSSDLSAGLSGKASTTHASTHGGAGSDPIAVAQSQVAGLTAGLAAKADLVAGLIPSAQIPALAITNTTVVASQAAMLALTAERGDVAIRTDNATTYILATDSPTTLADWKVILAPGQVVSVAGKTGVVALAAGDITSGTVDIARLPIGTSSTTVAAGNDARITGAAQRSGGNTFTGTQDFTGATVSGISSTASDATTGTNGLVRLAGDLAGTAASPTVPGLAAKAPIASPALTGTPTVPTAAVDTSTTQAASTAFVLAQAATATPLIDGTAAVGTSTRFARGDHKHPTDTTRASASTTVTAGTGLTGGGDLSANRTLAVSYGTGAGTAAQGNDTRVVNAVQSTTVANIVKLTQAAYDAIGTPTATTLYVIVG